MNQVDRASDEGLPPAGTSPPPAGPAAVWPGLAAAAAVFGMFLAYALLAPASYQATAHILLDPTSAQPPPIGDLKRAAHAIRTAGLDADTLIELRSAYPNAAQGAEAVQHLERNLDVVAASEHDYGVSFRDSDPARTQRLCNLLARRMASRASFALAPPEPPAESAEAIRARRTAALAAFSAAHPELAASSAPGAQRKPAKELSSAQIAALRAERDQLQAKLAGLPAPSGDSSDNPFGDTQNGVEADRARRRVQEIDRTLAQAQRTDDGKPASTAIDPAVEREYQRLRREAEEPVTLPAQPAAYRVRLAEAQLPSTPIKPPRRLLLLVGIFAAISVGLVIIVVGSQKKQRRRLHDRALLAASEPPLPLLGAGGSNPPPQYASSNPPPQYASSNPPPQYASGNPPPQYASGNPPPQQASSNPPRRPSSRPPAAPAGASQTVRMHSPFPLPPEDQPSPPAPILPVVSPTDLRKSTLAGFAVVPPPVVIPPARVIDPTPVLSVTDATKPTVAARTSPAEEPPPATVPIYEPPVPTDPLGQPVAAPAQVPTPVPQPYDVSPPATQAVPPPPSDPPQYIGHAEVEGSPVRRAPSRGGPFGTPNVPPEAEQESRAARRSPTRTTQMLGSPPTPVVRNSRPPSARPEREEARGAVRRTPTAYSYITSPPPQPPAPRGHLSTPAPPPPVAPNFTPPHFSPPRHPGYLSTPPPAGRRSQPHAAERPKIVTHKVHAHWQPDPSMRFERRRPLCDQILPLAVEGCFVIGVTALMEVRTQKSRVAAELAFALAEPNQPRVLLLEGDFQWPTVHQFLHIDVPMSAGFSQQLRQRVQGNPARWTVVECTPTLHVMAEGVMRSPGLILSSHFEDSMQSFRSYYDFVVIDGPLASEEVDCRALDAVTDGLVLVSPAEGSPNLAPALTLFSEKKFSTVLAIEG